MPINFADVKKNSVLLASYILAANPPMVQSQGLLYRYNDKFYDVVDDMFIDRIIMEFFKAEKLTELWKTGRITEIKRAFYADQTVVQEVEQMDSHPGMLCLDNGVFDVNKMVLVPHDPKYHFTSSIDVKYDPAQTATPVFSKFINSLFTDEHDKVDNETVENIIRLGGYLLYPEIKIPKLFLFLGEGANGKSLLIDVYSMFFNKRNISYLTLENLSSVNFVRTPLLKSRLNISTEAKSNAVDAEEIKKIISGEGITINPKFKEPMEFKPNTKIIIASNTRPYFNDTTHGLDRRLFIIAFKNRFVEPHLYKLIKNPTVSRVFPAEEYNALMKGIRAEKSAIFNLFLAALCELMNNGFSIKETLNSVEIKEDYKEGSDTAGYFLTEHYELDDTKFTFVTPDQVLAHYRDWYKANVSERPLNYSSIALGKKICDLFRTQSDKIPSTDGGRMRVYYLKRKQDGNEELGGDYGDAGEGGDGGEDSLPSQPHLIGE